MPCPSFVFGVDSQHHGRHPRCRVCELHSLAGPLSCRCFQSRLPAGMGMQYSVLQCPCGRVSEEAGVQDAVLLIGATDSMAYLNRKITLPDQNGACQASSPASGRIWDFGPSGPPTGAGLSQRIADCRTWPSAPCRSIAPQWNAIPNLADPATLECFSKPRIDASSKSTQCPQAFHHGFGH